MTYKHDRFNPQHPWGEFDNSRSAELPLVVAVCNMIRAAVEKTAADAAVADLTEVGAKK